MLYAGDRSPQPMNAAAARRKTASRDITMLAPDQSICACQPDHARARVLVASLAVPPASAASAVPTHAALRPVLASITCAGGCHLRRRALPLLVSAVQISPRARAHFGQHAIRRAGVHEAKSGIAGADPQRRASGAPCEEAFEEIGRKARTLNAAVDRLPHFEEPLEERRRRRKHHCRLTACCDCANRPRISTYCARCSSKR